MDFSSNKIQIKQTKKDNYLLTEDKQRINEGEYWNKYLSRILKLNLIQTIGEEFFSNLLSGMKMFVLSTPDSSFNKVIVEPLPDKVRKSQVDVFLSNHLGNGIQHLAFEVGDLVSTVIKLKNNGVNFTTIPSKYYDELALHSPELPIDFFLNSCLAFSNCLL